MKTFIQLKDDVTFAYVSSDRFVDNSIEVDGNGNDYINKKFVNGQWIDAPLIRYAILDKNNIVVQIEKTYFSSEVGNNPIIEDEDIDVLWSWDGINFNPPVTLQFVESEQVQLNQIEN
jgi:hypothetical protein